MISQHTSLLAKSNGVFHNNSPDFPLILGSPSSVWFLWRCLATHILPGQESVLVENPRALSPKPRFCRERGNETTAAIVYDCDRWTLIEDTQKPTSLEQQLYPKEYTTTYLFKNPAFFPQAEAILPSYSFSNNSLEDSDKIIYTCT